MIACIGCVVTFAGCGSFNISTLTENMGKLNDTIESYSQVLSKEENNINSTNYYNIDYGTKLGAKVNSEDKNYNILKIYSAIFSLATSYIDENISFVTSLTNEEIEDQTKIVELNSKIESFNSEVTTFVQKRNSSVQYFETYFNTADEVAILAKLRDFKREYANLVNIAVETSHSLTEIMITNVSDIKNYTINKLLSVYNKLYIVEIGSINWQNSPQTDAKTRIDAVLNSLESEFDNLCDLLSNNQEISSEKREDLNQKLSIFLDEMDSYNKALDGLNISNLYINYSNDLENYLKDNKNAEIYLEKIESFVNVVLKDFQNYLASILTI